jgi:hypothetical protein
MACTLDSFWALLANFIWKPAAARVRSKLIALLRSIVVHPTKSAPPTSKVTTHPKPFHCLIGVLHLH